MAIRNALIKQVDDQLNNGVDGETIKKFTEELHPAIIADRLENLEPGKIYTILQHLDFEIKADIFSHLDKNVSRDLSEFYDDDELADIFEFMPHDDRVDLFRVIPEERRNSLLRHIEPEEREDIIKLSSYPEGTAGALMTSDFVRIFEEMTVKEALNKIRKVARYRETIYIAYVVDQQNKLLGIVSLKDLIMFDSKSIIRDVMFTEIITVRVDDEREIVASRLSEYDLIAIPVTDERDRLVGIVTFDDALDVAEEEATEDFHKTAGLAPLERTYRDTSIFELFQKRIGWLMILVFVSLMSSGVIAAFEETLESAIALAFFIPLLIGSAGNAGAQAATLMVRALATDDVNLSGWLNTTGREILVGVMLGLVMGAACWVLGMFFGGAEIAIIVGLTMVSIILLANIIGTLLPFILTFFNMDPAVASSPLIATIMDATGLLIYFWIAILVLGSF